MKIIELKLIDPIQNFLQRNKLFKLQDNIEPPKYINTKRVMKIWKKKNLPHTPS